MSRWSTLFEIYFRLYKNGKFKILDAPGDYSLTEEDKKRGASSFKSVFESEDDGNMFDPEFGYYWEGNNNKPDEPGLYYGQVTIHGSSSYDWYSGGTEYEWHYTLDSFTKIDRIITKPRILRHRNPEEEHLMYEAAIYHPKAMEMSA